MEELIKQIKEKADSIETSTKIDRRVKGAYVDCLVMVKEALSIHDVMQSDYTPDMIAKHLEWDNYDHMKINEEHIEPQFKEAINMIFWLCKLEVPFYSA